MKVTKRQLRRIIKEEKRKLVTEAYTLYDEDDGVWEEYESLDELKADLEDISSRMDTDDWEVEDPKGNRVPVYKLEEGKSGRITKRQLRRLIKEEIYPLYPLRSLREAPAGDVEAAIAKYTSPKGQYAWRMAASDFYAMADGEIIPNVSDEYYAGWTPEDFETVITAVEG